MKYYSIFIFFFISNCFSHWWNDPNDYDQTRKHNLEPYKNMSDFLSNGANKYCADYYGKHRPKQEGCMYQYIMGATNVPMQLIRNMIADLSGRIADLTAKLAELTNNQAECTDKVKNCNIDRNKLTGRVDALTLKLNDLYEYTNSLFQLIVPPTGEGGSSDIHSGTQAGYWYAISGIGGIFVGATLIIAYQRGWFGKIASYFMRKPNRSDASVLYDPNEIVDDFPTSNSDNSTANIKYLMVCC